MRIRPVAIVTRQIFSPQFNIFWADQHEMILIFHLVHIALGTKPIFPFCSGIPPISFSSLWDESLNRHELILNDLGFFMILKELSISVFCLNLLHMSKIGLTRL